MQGIDILIIVVFLAATLWIGWASGRQIKTFQEYAIGNRTFSNFAVFCTVAATMIGGSATMGFVGKVYAVGLVHVLAPIGLPIAFLIIGLVVVPRMRKFYGCCSIGEMFERSYGLSGRYIVGFVSFFIMLLASVAQIEAMGLIICKLLNISYVSSILVSAAILFLYTGHGGVKAVTMTDILQFVVLIIALPLILSIGLYKIGSWENFVTAIPPDFFVFKSEDLHRYVPLFFVFCLPTLAPMFVQRLLLTKSVMQGCYAFCGTAILYLFLIVILVGVGLVAIILFPNLERADMSVPVLIHNLMPVGIKGFTIAGMLAILMSTADSSLNAASVAFANDILLPSFRKPLSEALKLKIVRGITYIFGIISIVVSLSYNVLFEVEIIYDSLWFSTTLVPLYFCIFNRKVRLSSLFLSMGVGFFSMLFWNIFLRSKTHIDGVFPGLFANALTFILCYIKDGRNKVFEHIKHESLFRILFQEERQDWVNEGINETRCNLIIGFYLLIMQILPMVFFSRPNSTARALFMIVNGFMALLLIFGSQFPIFYKRHFIWFRELTLWLCLPITSTFLVFNAENGCLHLVSFGLSLLLLNVLSVAKYSLWTSCASLVMVVLVAVGCFLSGQPFTVPTRVSWFHILYLGGFLIVLFAIWYQRTAMALRGLKKMRNLSQDFMLPMLVQKMVLDKKLIGDLTPAECRLFKESMDDMSQIIDSLSCNTLSLKSLKLENINTLVRRFVAQKQYLCPHLNLQIQEDAEVRLKVDPVLWSRVFLHLVNLCIESLPSLSNGQLTIRLSQENGFFVVSFFNKLTGLSREHLKNVLIQDSLEGKSDYISWNILQDWLKQWNASLEIVDDATYGTICQIRFPIVK